MSAYAELAVTTNFSFLRGASHPEELVSAPRSSGLAGIGIADRNRSPAWCAAHANGEGMHRTVKLAVGARLVFADGTPDILAYPQDRAAWGRLTRLLTVGKRAPRRATAFLACRICWSTSKGSISS